ERFRTLAPQHRISVWPDQVGDPTGVHYACVWHPPPGLLAGFGNLKAIFSLGAGADDLLADPTLPAVPVVRIVDADLTMRMTEYVVLHVLMHHRRQRLYDAQQRERLWREHEQPAASDVWVGVMGLGVLGVSAARLLQHLGFRVRGWSRTGKTLPGIATFHGRAGLEPFLRGTEILACLLPATPATRGIINLDLIRKLNARGALGGAFLINAGRGALQVDADILAALDEGARARPGRETYVREGRSPAGARCGVSRRRPLRGPTRHRRCRKLSRSAGCGGCSACNPACRWRTWSLGSPAIEAVYRWVAGA